jgi:hypothetical protein
MGMFMTSNISRLLEIRVSNTILVIHTLITENPSLEAISRHHFKKKNMGESIPKSTRKLYLKKYNARSMSNELLFGLRFGSKTV